MFRNGDTDMQSSNLPDPPTDTVADSPTDDASVTGHDSPQPTPPEVSDAPEVTDTPDAAETPDTPVASEPPDAAETPDAPDTSETLELKPEPQPVEVAAASAATTAPATRPNRTAPLIIGAIVLLIAGVVGVFLIAPPDKSATPTAQPTPAASSAAAATPTPAAASAGPTGPVTSDLNAIKVSGTGQPTVVVPAPFAVEKTSKRVLTAGTGKAVAAGQTITIDYVGVNGTNGKTFDTSFGKTDPVSFIVGDANLIKGMNEGLSGVAVGSRVLLAIPAVDGYGTNGAPDAGIGPKDTLVFVIDVKSATNPLKRATGTAVAPKAGLPTVALDSATGKPTITVPKATAPTALVVQPLITGTGATVAKGQTITVHYTGAIWASGKVFDSSWTNGAPASFAIGTGNVIPGWDTGLVGQKVGSQVLLVIPPADGYGTAGAPDAGIAGTDTLVFVVDILAVS